METPPDIPHADIARALIEMTSENRAFREQMYLQMTGTMESLVTSVDALNETSAALHAALAGDELGNPGIVSRQDGFQGQIDEERKERREADRRIHQKIEKIQKWIYIAIGAGIASGIGVAEIIQTATSTGTP